MKNNLQIVSVYDVDEKYHPLQKGIEEYLDRDITFKYVLFRGAANPELHLLRLSPLKKYESGLIGDTHLTIIGKLINEFKEKRELGINELDFRQDSGHGLLWLIREKEGKENPLIICAETGAFMDIKNRDISFYGESQALKGGKVYGIDEKERNLEIIWDKYKHSSEEIKGREKYIINPAYSIPAKMIGEELKGKEGKIYLPNVRDERIEFNLEEITEKFKDFFNQV